MLAWKEVGKKKESLDFFSHGVVKIFFRRKMYKELRKILPRSFKTLISGIRGYASLRLGYYEARKQILEDKKKTIEEKRKDIKNIRYEVDQLSILLFIYALYRKFLQGDKMLKDTVDTFESLDIKSVHIGALELSRSSPYYNLGRELADSLYSTIESDEIKCLFEQRPEFHEIAGWYKRNK